MIDFCKLYNEFEKTIDVCKFCRDYSENNTAIRFLLIRSLDKVHLKEIISKYSSDNSDNNVKGNFLELTEKAYASAVTVEQLVSYIESKRKELIKQRENELEGLADLLVNFPIVNCGVRDDKVDGIIKGFVRNKSLKTKAKLFNKLDRSVLPRIRQYCLWSYYNQTSNDIIELFFLKHKSIIPTLRKIHNIDFFLKIGNDIIPIDLKITHISDEYFDLASQGIVRNSDNASDAFLINNKTAPSETEQIKSFYKDFKSKYNKKHSGIKLSNMKGLNKDNLCSLLLDTKNDTAIQFVEKIKRKHAAYVPTNSDELYALEWWN